MPMTPPPYRWPDPDRDYMNGAFIPGAADYPSRWQAEAAAFRSALGPRALLDQPYGPAPRQRFDLFLPEAPPKGTLVYIHGGYWHLFDKSHWSHLAAGALARGFAVAMPGYTLAPEARLADMTAENRRRLPQGRRPRPGADGGNRPLRRRPPCRPHGLRRPS
ncbi:MAG: hypothetical protein HC783_18055, partial [Rhodobacteraceae bacterium]|nr:hypothetical protein [Paracoccaceae bacterium]